MPRNILRPPLNAPQWELRHHNVSYHFYSHYSHYSVYPPQTPNHIPIAYFR